MPTVAELLEALPADETVDDQPTRSQDLQDIFDSLAHRAVRFAGFVR